MSRKRKKMTIEEPAESPKVDLTEQIKSAAEGLWYISETDAEIFPFTGSKADAVTKENLLSQIGKPPDTPVEERGFDEIFARFLRIEDWYGDEEKATAEKFAALKNLLAANLSDLKVFKVGQIELDVYFVGLDANGNLAGIQTKAVET
ncbi:MAG: nuclease A inhibitor family protein [Acidobacteria bacterium]|nr:nuclease A inhibitor family protein [Acidobacteriota bacterium]